MVWDRLNTEHVCCFSFFCVVFFTQRISTQPWQECIETLPLLTAVLRHQCGSVLQTHCGCYWKRTKKFSEWTSPGIPTTWLWHTGIGQLLSVVLADARFYVKLQLLDLLSMKMHQTYIQSLNSCWISKYPVPSSCQLLMAIFCCLEHEFHTYYFRCFTVSRWSFVIQHPGSLSAVIRLWWSPNGHSTGHC